MGVGAARAFGPGARLLPPGRRAMAPLFFALAAASSESGGGSGADRLALLPGVGGGWLSARCCEYPQELIWGF